MVLEFDMGVIPSCSNVGASAIKIQMSTQSKALSGTAPTKGLTAPSWASPTSLTSPFEFGDIRADAAPEAGAIGTDELSLEADNYVIGVIGGTDVRIYDVLLGKQSTIDFDTDDTFLHVRLLHKAAGASAYTVRYWGIVDYSSIECIMGDVSDKDTWKIKCKVVDTAAQLEEYTMIDYVDAVLPMSTAYTSTAKYLTFVGDLTYGSFTVAEGRYALRNLRWDDGGQSQWLGQRQNPTVPDGNSALDPMRFFRIVDIIGAAHTFLGLEGTVLDGATWTLNNAWRWYYADSAPGDALALEEVGLDELYVVAGLYVWDGAQYVYAHRGTFFDRDGSAPHSIMAKGNPLEALKDICTSLGMTFRVSVNASGARYLDVRAADAGNATITWDADQNWYSDVKVQPFSRRITGIEVSSGQENIRRGSVGNESVKVQCLFTCANHIRTDADFLAYPQGISPSPNTSVVVGASGTGNTMSDAFWSCLWAMGGSPTGQNYPGAYTVCMVLPAMSGGTARGGTYVCVQRETEGGQQFDLGRTLTAPATTYGGVDFSVSSAFDNIVVYPNTVDILAADAPCSSWAEVPAMALSHYLFSPRRVDLDCVGIYRAKGMQIEITRGEIIGTSIPLPGSRVEIPKALVGAVQVDPYVTCRVVSVSENLLENTTTFTLEYWAV